MKNIFATGEAQDIPAVLANKDHRAAVQQKLVVDYPEMTVVAAKLNIPGPIKNNRMITHFFITELKKLEKQWLESGVLFYQKKEWLNAGTGPERFYLLKANARDVKQQTTVFEEATPSHRLFDLDVLVMRNEQVQPISRTESGQPVRRCFVCGRPAKECGRSRRHSVDELQAAVNKLITKALDNDQRITTCQQLVQDAQRALLYEMMAWPKPGLVDPLEHNAHPDMDAFTFVNSSLSLHNYLEQAAKLGLFTTSSDYPLMFTELREFGKQAEKDMFMATGGINTHKGAVFSLGILVMAVADTLRRLGKVDLKEVQSVVKKMLVNLIKKDLQLKSAQQKKTAGEQQYDKYGLTGIRGEAQAGYPTVFNYGLPTLQKTNGNWNIRIIQTFLALAAHTEDSTLVKRAGNPQILKWKDEQINRCLAAGGVKTSEGYNILKQLEKEFSTRHLSLGGTADLLIVTIFLDLVKENFSNGFSN